MRAPAGKVRRRARKLASLLLRLEGGMTMRLPLTVLVGASLLLAPVSSFAEVPVADAQREGSETNTAVCMQRARTFKQGSVAPTKNIHGSVTIQSDTGGIRSVTG